MFFAQISLTFLNNSNNKNCLVIIITIIIIIIIEVFFNYLMYTCWLGFNYEIIIF